jgi:hypothetical protein
MSEGKPKERTAFFTVPDDYPMAADNPLRDMTDDEIRAYIRKRREEFMAPGGKWDQYQAEQAKLTKKVE